MKRHEVWRHKYRKRRDLDHLTPEELSERFHDCLNNSRTRTDRNKLGLRSLKEPVGLAWMVLGTEVMEECHLRGYPYPGPINLAPFRTSIDHAFDPIPDINRAMAVHGKSPYLLKFGDPKWIRLAFDQGRFRVGSASYYDSADHNHARRDTELSRHFRLNPRDSQRQGMVASGSAYGDGWTKIEASSDYLLFCLATQYSARLFGDFASSACLVIHHPRFFLDKIAAALQAKLPRWRIQTGGVTYYDPVRYDPRKVVVPWFKSFRHAYQQEWRVACTPPEPLVKLDPLEIEIGPLEDCATYVDCETHPPPVLAPDPKENPVRSFGITQGNPSMINHLPEAAKFQGFVLHKEGARDTWYFEMQYTDAAGKWHQWKITMKEGLHLMNLLQAADKEQALSFLNQKGAW